MIFKYFEHYFLLTVTVCVRDTVSAIACAEYIVFIRF